LFPHPHPLKAAAAKPANLGQRGSSTFCFLVSDF
jgi:hypothetical protein